MDDMTSVDLSGFESPWVTVMDGGGAGLLNQFRHFRNKGGVVVTLEGAELTSVDGLFTAFATSLQFPAYFGRNWDALVDCLVDLHPHVVGERGLLLRVANAGRLLEVDHLGILFEVLCQAAESSNSPVDADGLPVDRPVRLLRFLFELEEASWGQLRERLAGRSLVITDNGPTIGVELAPGYWGGAP